MAYYDIYSGQTSTGITLNNDIMYVMSGGVANRTTVNNWGSMYISSGGVADDTTVNLFGSLHISSGGVANSTTVNSGGSMYVSSGGVAKGATVNDHGVMRISSGGVVNDAILTGGEMLISSGGLATDITISGGALYISSGGTATDIEWTPCIGHIGAADGAVVTYVSSYSGVYCGYGQQLLSHADTITGKRGMYSTYIMSGGVANDMMVNNGGFIYIFSGGIANDTTVNSQGLMYISSGGVANCTTVSGVDSRGYYGKLHISNGGVANGTILTAGKMYISNGGVASVTIVNELSHLNISSGGVAEKVFANDGQITISSGGYAKIGYNPWGNRGSVTSANGASVVFETIEDVTGIYYGNSSASLVNYWGNVHSGLQIQSGFSAIIYDNGIVSATTINNDGYMYISRGGVASVTRVNSWGSMHISSGGVANDTTINTYGRMYISNGGVADVTRVIGWSYLNINSGGVANNTTVIEDGRIYISGGGVASVTRVNSFGSMYISSGGCHKGSLQIENGAVVSAYSGAIIDFTVADRTEEDGYLINDLSRISGAPTYTITVAADQASGTYKLAQGAGNFTGTISIGNGSVNYGFITINGEDFIYDNRAYSLDNVGGNLTLSILSPPEVPTAVLNTTDPTNQDVVVTVTYSEDSTIRQYKIGNGEWLDYQKAFSVSDNSTVYFRAANAIGESFGSIIISNIDKIAPTLEISGNATVLTNQNITLTATASDGIVEYFDGKNWVKGNTLPVSENGTYHFRVTDAAGNVTEKSVFVDKIDKIAPTLEISGNATAPTNQSITLTATASDGIVEYFDGENWVKGSTLSVSENGTYRFRVTDAAGNVTEKSVFVDKIDKIAPPAPELTSNMGKRWSNAPVTIWADGGSCAVEYDSSGNWIDYDGSFTVFRNGEYKFRVVDPAGNYSDTVSYLVDKIDPVADSSTTDYVFVNAKYSAKNTGKKQNGVVLVYQQNAFASVDAALQKYPGLTGKLLVITDSNINGNACVDLDVVAGAAIRPTIKESAGSYSYKATSAPKGTLTISQDTGSTRFIRFSKVNVYDAEVGTISGGKSSSSETWTETLKKGVFSEKEKFSCSFSTSGNITIQSGASLDQLDGFSKVVISESFAGTVTAFHCKDSRSKTATYDDAKHTVSRKITLSNQKSASGTLTVTDSLLGAVTGFATVTLKNSAVSGDLRRVDANGNPYSTVKETYNVKTNKDGSVFGTYSKTETFARSGKLTAQNSVVGNIENFSTVTLDNSCAGNISNIRDSKVVTSGTALWRNVAEYGKPDGYDLDLDAFFLSSSVTSSLNGAVTLKNGALASGIANFKTVSMAASTVEMISNVNKVTVNAGESTIGTYIGTDSSDTLSIAKGAVLFLHALDLGAGAKDTVSVAGTLILTGTDYKNATFAGKGVVAAKSAVCAQLNLANEINLGETANGFRGVDVENSDDLLGQAALWNGEGELTGWLGSWSGYASGKDTVDYLKFSAQAGDKVQISGLDAADWTLLDLKGNEISSIAADGTYFLKLEHDEADSVSYAIQLA